MGKESGGADDRVDAAVDGWTRIILKGKKNVFVEKPYNIDFTARSSQGEAPTIPTIEGTAHEVPFEIPANAVESPGLEVLKEFESRVMKAVGDGLKEVNKKVDSLGNWVTHLEKEVIYLMTVPRLSVIEIAKQAERTVIQSYETEGAKDGCNVDSPQLVKGGDERTESEKDGGGKEDDGGQKEDGDDEEEDGAQEEEDSHMPEVADKGETAELTDLAEMAEMSEKVQKVQKQYKRMRKSDG